jgi:hypothetical protein
MKSIHFFFLTALIAHLACNKKKDTSASEQAEVSTSKASSQELCLDKAMRKKLQVDPSSLTPPAKVTISTLVGIPAMAEVSFALEANQTACKSIYIKAMDTEQKPRYESLTSSYLGSALVPLSDDKPLSIETSCCVEEEFVSAALRAGSSPSLNRYGQNFYCGKSQTSGTTSPLPAPSATPSSACRLFWQEVDDNKSEVLEQAMAFCYELKNSGSFTAAPLPIAQSLAASSCLAFAEEMYLNFAPNEAAGISMLPPPSFSLTGSSAPDDAQCLDSNSLEDYIKQIRAPHFALTANEISPPLPTASGTNQSPCSRKFPQLSELKDLKWSGTAIRGIYSGSVVFMVGLVVAVGALTTQVLKTGVWAASKIPGMQTLLNATWGKSPFATIIARGQLQKSSIEIEKLEVQIKGAAPDGDELNILKQDLAAEKRFQADIIETHPDLQVASKLREKETRRSLLQDEIEIINQRIKAKPELESSLANRYSALIEEWNKLPGAELKTSSYKRGAMGSSYDILWGQRSTTHKAGIAGVAVMGIGMATVAGFGSLGLTAASSGNSPENAVNNGATMMRMIAAFQRRDELTRNGSVMCVN